MDMIPAEQCRERIRAENPWWDEGSPHTDQAFQNMRPRAYLEPFAALVEAIDVRRAVVLMGARRIGKTVLLQHMIQRLLDDGVPPQAIAYLSLDQPLYANRSIEELIGHVRVAGAPPNPPPMLLPVPEIQYLFLDEIQYLRDWERHLKVFVDDHPRIKCVVSGSAAAALRLKSIESGAGRFTDFLLPPLTFYEFMDLQDMGDVVACDQQEGFCNDVGFLNEHFVRYVNMGGYPEVIFSESIREDVRRYVRSDIIDKVLLRDLPSLYGIRDIQELNSLFMTLAWHTAQEVSLQGLSQHSGVSSPTIKSYLEYLEAAFLIRIVHRIDRNARHFKRANYFKVHLTAPSMRSALFGPIESNGRDMGALVETAIFSQWFHANLELRYARWQSGEVDIVCLDERYKPRWCVEVQWSDSAVSRRRKTTPIRSFLQTHSGVEGAFTTRSMEGKLSLAPNVTVDYLPASVYCYLAGFHAVGDRSRDLVLGVRERTR